MTERHRAIAKAAMFPANPMSLFLSTWMSHWSGATCYGPKLSLRYEADEAGSTVKNDREGASEYIDGRENLMLTLAPSGTWNSESKSGKQMEANRNRAPSPNRPILDLSISSPFPTDELHRLPNHRCMNNHFPVEGTSREGSLFRGFCNWSRGVPRMPPSSAHDGETMRIFTTIDTIAAGSSRGAPTFSQTTRHFMFTKTDVNVPRGESSTPSDFNDKAFREFLTLPTEALVSSENDNDKLIYDPKNESSAETEVLDMEVEKEESKLPISLFLATPFKEELSELPDINNEAPAEGTLVKEDDASTSRTESLDADHLFYDATTKSGFSIEKESKEDYSNRWVKRLKPSSTLAFAYGTKSAEMEEGSSKSKSHCLFHKVLRLDKAECKGERMGESVGLPASCKNKWIQRWSCIGKLEEKNGENKGVEDDDVLKEKQFPSIAAMALMGKAMNGLRQCAYRKKGSVMLWNTDDIDDDEIH